MPDPLIRVVAEIASTNSALLERVSQGEAPAEGQWLVADRQTTGRGRAGRVWSDGFGNFMGSTAVALHDAETLPQTLALVAGLSVHRALLAVVPELAGLALKWPNDLLVGEAKLGGILLERQRDAVIVGIGVNLAVAPEVPGRQTASLAGLGFTVSRDAFASALAAAWAEDLTAWHAGGWPMLREAWLVRSLPKGTLLGVNLSEEGRVIGGFAGLEPDGAALLRLADGSVRAIHAGDVELVGPSRADVGGNDASGG